MQAFELPSGEPTFLAPLVVTGVRAVLRRFGGSAAQNVVRAGGRVPGLRGTVNRSLNQVEGSSPDD